MAGPHDFILINEKVYPHFEVSETTKERGEILIKGSWGHGFV